MNYFNSLAATECRFPLAAGEQVMEAFHKSEGGRYKLITVPVFRPKRFCSSPNDGLGLPQDSQASETPSTSVEIMKFLFTAVGLWALVATVNAAPTPVAAPNTVEERTPEPSPVSTAPVHSYHFLSPLSLTKFTCRVAFQQRPMQRPS